MFPHFLKKTAEVLAPRLTVVFRLLLRLGSFPVCWRVPNVTPISKGPPTSSASNYRPVSLTPILSIFLNVLGVLWNADVCFQPHSSLIRKVLALVMPLFFVAHTLQSALEMGQEARRVQIDFSAAFDRVSHQGILFKLCSVGVGGSVLSVLTQFFAKRSQYVVVDGCRSKLVNPRGASGKCQGCLGEVFWARSCFSCALQSFSL